MHLKISSEKWQPFCPGGDELRLLAGRAAISGQHNIIAAYEIYCVYYCNKESKWAQAILLHPVGCSSNVKSVIPEQTVWIEFRGIFYEIAQVP